MAVGIIAFVADGEKRAWPNPLAGSPLTVTLNDIATAFTINSNGEVDVGAVPVAGTVVKLLPASLGVFGPDVRIKQLPLLTQYCLHALKRLYDTAGTQDSGVESWGVVVENNLIDTAADPLAAKALDISRSQFMPPGGAGWVAVQSILATRYGWSNPTAALRMSTAQLLARNMQNAA